MLTLLLLYAYCVRTVSSRKIERACYENLAFSELTGNQQPDHSRISDFRRRNLDALKGLFVQILRLCQKAGIGEPGARGPGWHQGQSQCQQAQGNQPRADAQG